MDEILTQILAYDALWRENTALYSEWAKAQGLSWQEAWELQNELKPLCACKVARGRSLWTEETALAAEPVPLDREPRQTNAQDKPLSFGRTVGAILAALAIWNLVWAVLSSL